MLQIVVPAVNAWDESKQEFVNLEEQTLKLEHSLVSLSKWEQKWHKPFLTKQEKTLEETLDYIKCMTLTQNVKPETYLFLSDENFEQIKEYIDDPMTATTFSDDKKKSNHEIATSELIYYWMIALNIPQEYQKWHLNRLLTLIRVCNIKNTPAKKMSTNETISYYNDINEANKKLFNTTG